MSSLPPSLTDTVGARPRAHAGEMVLVDRQLVIAATLALAAANARYWTTVAPHVRRQLARWRSRAEAVADPRLRALALDKLDGEGFNAQAAAMLATAAPAARRADVVEAIVALQVLFDLLDGLTERPQPSTDPLAEGERLFAAFTDAVRPLPQPAVTPRGEDGALLAELSSAARCALERLPAAQTVMDVASASAQRAAQAQIRMHAAPRLGTGQLASWAQQHTDGTGLQWRELLAGAASSVLAVHALIAAAADPATTALQAAEIDSTYLSICVLVTLLDSLTDHDQDSCTGELGYIALYDDRERLARTLTDMPERAARQAAALPGAAHHLMILTAVVAYYASAPGARGELAQPHVAQLCRTLRPLVGPPLLVMRAWRLARGLRRAP